MELMQALAKIAREKDLHIQVSWNYTRIIYILRCINTMCVLSFFAESYF